MKYRVIEDKHWYVIEPIIKHKFKWFRRDPREFVDNIFYAAVFNKTFSTMNMALVDRGRYQTWINNGTWREVIKALDQKGHYFDFIKYLDGLSLMIDRSK